MKAYAAAGTSQDGPCLVFIHGMMEGWEIWERICREYLTEYSVHFLEFPWMGRQGNLWGFAAQPEEWIREGLALLPREPVAVVAHSFGANALLEHFCRNGAGSVKRAALLSPFYKKTYAGFDWDTFCHYVGNLGKFMEECLKVRQGNRPMPREILDSVSAKVKDQLGVLGWLHFFNCYTRMPGLDLASLRARFLVLGGRDDFSALAEDAEDLARGLPGCAAHILSDCGHFCMLERPNEVIAILSPFLASRI
ncbi:MAG TPA: alpha/beta hydrolase [Fibrobacteria bacterium]|nr:alpha/beta hydrolase [Fibrobacteria bacterium]